MASPVIRLDETDKKIIYLLELDARADRQSIANTLRLPINEVGDRIDRLIQKRVIGPANTIINIAKLGFTGHAVFIKLSSSKPRTQNKILGFLQKTPSVYWISQVSGPYDLIIAVQTRDYIEFDEVLKSIIKQFGSVIDNYVISTRVQANHFHRKYLWPEAHDAPDLFFGKYRPTDELSNDEEKRLVNFLSNNADYSFEDAGSYLNRSSRHAASLIAKLTRDEVILGYHTAVSPDQFDVQTFQILITAKDFSKDISLEFFQYCARHPNITFLVQAIGPWQYEITYEIPIKSDIDIFITELKRRFGFIQICKTLPTQQYYFYYRLGYPLSKTDASIKPRAVEDGDMVAFKELQRSVSKDVFDFEYCPGYIIQATRNFPLVVYLDGNIFFITRKIGDNKSNYVVVAGGGFGKSRALLVLCRYLYKKSKQPIIIKNVDEVWEKELKALAGFRDYGQGENWNQYARYDDQTFPQIIINNKKLLDLKGKDYSNLREKLSWFDKRFNLEVIPYQNEHQTIFDELLDRWASDMERMHQVPKKDLIESHLMYRELKDYYYQYLVFEKATKKWVGYISLSPISENVCGFNALLNDFSYEEMYKKMMYKAIEIASRLGFAYTNLQGSETEKQFQVKAWFVPDRLINKKHLVFEEK